MGNETRCHAAGPEGSQWKPLRKWALASVPGCYSLVTGMESEGFFGLGVLGTGTWRKGRGTLPNYLKGDGVGLHFLCEGPDGPRALGTKILASFGGGTKLTKTEDQLAR